MTARWLLGLIVLLAFGLGVAQQQDDARRVLEQLRALERVRLGELAAAHQAVRALELLLERPGEADPSEAEVTAAQLVADATEPPSPVRRRVRQATARRPTQARSTATAGKWDAAILRALKGHELRASEVARSAGLPGTSSQATVRAHGALAGLVQRGQVVRHGKLYGLPKAPAKAAEQAADDVVWNGAKKRSVINGQPLSEVRA